MMIAKDDRPTIREYAMLSQHVYGNGDDALPREWSILPRVINDLPVKWGKIFGQISKQT